MIDVNIFVSFLFIFITAISVYFKIVNQYVFIIWVASVFFLLSHYKFKFSKKSFCNTLTFFNKKSFYFLLFLFFIPRIIILYNSGVIQSHQDDASFAFYAYHALDKAFKTMNFNILGDVQGPMSWFPAIWYYIVGAMEHIFGFNNYIPRLFALVTDLAMLCGVWFYCIRILKSQKIAFASCFVYNFFFPNIFYSRVILNNNQSSLMLLLVLISLMIASEKEDNSSQKNTFEINRYYVVTGVLSGFALYFYLSSIIIPIYIIGFLFFYSSLNKFRDFKTVIKNCCYYFLGYLFTAIPFWIYSFFIYNFLGGRYGVNVLDRYREDFFPFLKLQVTRFISSLYKSSFGISTGFYTEQSLFDNYLDFILFVLGFLVFLFCVKNKKIFVLIIFFIITVVFGSLCTENPPAVQRITPIFWMISIILGFIICKIGDVFEKVVYVVTKKHLLAKFVGGFCISVLLMINLYKSIGTFDRGLAHLKKRLDLSLGFLPIYKKVKLPLYTDAPQHVDRLIPLYIGDPHMKIVLLYFRKDFYRKEHKPHYLLKRIRQKGVRVGLRKLKRDYIKLKIYDPNTHEISQVYDLYVSKKYK